MSNPQAGESHERDTMPGDGPDGLGAFVRRVLSPGPTSEERLEALIAERRRELDEHAAKFDAKIADLERREEILRDSRASVERMLRLGANDLEAKETDVAELIDELQDRETRLRVAEAELERRRGEVGAVELKRAAVDQRERTVAMREERIEQLEARLDERGAPDADAVPAPSARPVSLAFVPGPEYRLVEIDPTPLHAGVALVLAGEPYVVVRTGPSPLPGDERRCAYLVQGVRGASRSDGSS